MNDKPMMNMPSNEMTTVNPGEHHGATSGVERHDRCLLRFESGLQALPIPRDDEEGVVDTDPDTDHRAERHREVGHRDHVRQQRDQAGADTDAEQGHADRQAHREDRTEREDQDDDREAQTDQFGLGRLELAERLATDLDLQALDVGRSQLGDLGADLAGVGLAEGLGEIDLGIGHLPGQRAVGGDQPERCALRGVRAQQGDALDRRDLVEQFGHRCDDLGIVDALIGAEDDRAGAATARTTEVLIEGVEATFRFGVRDRERAVARGADRADQHDHRDQGGHPDAEDQPATAETESSEPAPRRVGDLHRDVRRTVGRLVRAVGIIGLFRCVPRGSGRHVHYWTF
jgi:hypothetical protein